jgi:mRNA interferase MazF
VAVFPRTFPRRGEVYQVNFDPARGSEQAGIRPALVVSNDVNNQHGRVVTVVAITKTIPPKSYPFNVHLTAGVLPLDSTIMCGQILTIDKTRLMQHRGNLDQATMAAVAKALAVSLDLPRQSQR